MRRVKSPFDMQESVSSLRYLSRAFAAARSRFCRTRGLPGARIQSNVFRYKVFAPRTSNPVGVATMEFYRIWRILAGHRRLVIWLPIIAAFGWLAVTYVLPELDESTALVLVRPFEGIKFDAGGGPKKEILDFL